MSNKLTVAPSPHMKSADTTKSIMTNVVIALMPALIAAVAIFGLGALILTVTCVVSCVAAEFIYNKLTKRDNTITDMSAVVTGVLLAYNLPASLPLWIAVVGSITAIIVVKQLFGGIGQNFANPAITARVILLVSFAGQMTTWPAPNFGVASFEGVAGATPLAVMTSGAMYKMPSYMEMFLGFRGGCLGETCTVALLLGGIYLIYKKVITPIIPVSFLGTIVVMALLLGTDPLYHLMAGGAMIGAFFMATDYSTSPNTLKGQVIFGIGCGFITMIIRVFGGYPEGVSFAILLMNIVTPHINNYTMTKPFGGAK